MGKRGKLSANKSNSSNGGANKKIKTNGQGNGTSSHANTSKRSQARSNPKPDAIDDDLWPAEEAFRGSELENLELVRTVMMKQMKRIEQELFREDHNNQLAGIKTQVESPSKGPGKEQTDDGNRNKAQPASDGASSSSKTPDAKAADKTNDAKGGTSKSSSTSNSNLLRRVYEESLCCLSNSKSQDQSEPRSMASDFIAEGNLCGQTLLRLVSRGERRLRRMRART